MRLATMLMLLSFGMLFAKVFGGAESENAQYSRISKLVIDIRIVKRGDSEIEKNDVTFHHHKHKQKPHPMCVKKPRRHASIKRVSFRTSTKAHPHPEKPESVPSSTAIRPPSKTSFETSFIVSPTPIQQNLFQCLRDFNSTIWCLTDVLFSNLIYHRLIYTHLLYSQLVSHHLVYLICPNHNYSSLFHRPPSNRYWLHPRIWSRGPVSSSRISSHCHNRRIQPV